jgi:hypothetical protein
MPFVFLIISIILNFSYAQYPGQPEKESSSDLRSRFQLFRIEIVQDQISYQLERSSNEEYFLTAQGKNQKGLTKIARSHAMKLDQLFSSDFLKAEFEILTKEGPCEVTLRLTMKGQEQLICKKDDEKARTFSQIISDLKTLSEK